MANLHVMTCQFYKLNELIQEMNFNHLILALLFSFIIFIDRTRIYNPTRIGFMIFGQQINFL
jgi:hypothetical protein